MISSTYFKSLIRDAVYELEKVFPYASGLALETWGERLTVQTRQQQGFKISGTDHTLSLVTFRSSLPYVPLYSEA